MATAPYHPDPPRSHASAVKPAMQPIPSLAHLQPNGNGAPPPQWAFNGELHYNPAGPHQTVASAIPPHARQLRPMRSPCYTPVALRVTQYPSQTLWLSRRRESSASTASEDVGEGGPLSPTIDRTMSNVTGISQSSNGTTEVGIVFEEEWTYASEMSSPVDGPPTREHWKPDSQASSCDYPLCAVSFSLLQRRHHCRRCGLIFCGTHTPHNIPLDQFARFHTQGARVRGCDDCWEDYRAWETMRCSRSNSCSEASSQQNSPPRSGGAGIAISGSRRPSLMVGVGGGDLEQQAQAKPPLMAESVAGSVPRNWEWSTF